MKSGLRRKTGGFTILETIIVLTVTIAILSSTLLLFRGRIPRIQFSKAVNELSVRITDTANQVAVGNYPGASDTKCDKNASGKPEISVSGSSMGTNQDCIFLGQAIKFGPDSCIGAGKECDELKIYTIFGLRLFEGGGVTKLTTKLSEATPTSSNTIATQDYNNGYGLSVTKVTTDGLDSYGGVAYVQSFGSSFNPSVEVEGSQQISIIPIDGTTLGMDYAVFASNINSSNLTTINPASGITVCLKSGTTDQYAVLILGEGGNASSVEQQILDKPAWITKGC